MEAILASEYVTIGELVRLTECRYSTLKFYTEEGMIPLSRQNTILRGDIGEKKAWNVFIISNR